MFDQDKIYLYEKINCANRTIPQFSIKEAKFTDENEFWIKYENSEYGVIEEKFTLNKQ